MESDTKTKNKDLCDPAASRAPRYPGHLDSQQRQQLLLENLPEVRHIARRIHSRLPPHVPFDDLVHSGVLGLMDALEKFDPAKNPSFRGYAQFRVRGAILDSLRKMDWCPRSLRRQARRIAKAQGDLASELRRSPSEAEVAAHLGVPLDEFQNILTELHYVNAATRQEQSESVLGGEGSALRSNRSDEDPFQLCARAETSRMLSQAIDTLEEQQRRVLALYFFEERTMKEIAAVLDVCESRVSQIASVALDRLRTRVQKQMNAHKPEARQNSERKRGEIAINVGAAWPSLFCGPPQLLKGAQAANDLRTLLAPSRGT